MKVYELDIHLSWILLLTTIFSVILIVFICVCWKGRKRDNKSYIMNSDKNTITTTLASNSIPKINSDKQKYFLHDVQYSSINHSGELSASCNIKTNDHFSYNILSIFKNIQNNKFGNTPDDLSKMLPDTLEDSSTDAMHKNFDKSVLCLQWNETPDNSRLVEKDETYSCISSDSKTTFTSVVPFYNRSYSVAETFKSTNSDN